MLQNHRITEMSRDFLRSLRPNPLLNQGQLELAAQDCDLNISTDGDSTTSALIVECSAALIQPLTTTTVKKNCVQMESHRF